MKLSKLQKYILLQCWYWKRKKAPRQELLKFYDSYKKRPSEEDMTNIITKSLVRLIKKNLVVGFGELTSQKTFIQSVRLTREGRKEVRRLLDRQQKLPLKIKKTRNQKNKKSSKV
ncbi:hypothetical protein KKD19_05360 [Patescibacteria group bacterium]|nr:hypothetical protein [Patescibacteria group bacterium]MBU4512633.1 hypothetical protein [Patescibacteria group bacterium]MCG2693539.1 hypothetical protein [Candidatus Parcubacteria bacterium]